MAIQFDKPALQVATTMLHGYITLSKNNLFVA